MSSVSAKKICDLDEFPAVRLNSALVVLWTVNCLFGEVVPIPTFPVLSIRIRSEPLLVEKDNALSAFIFNKLVSVAIPP